MSKFTISILTYLALEHSKRCVAAVLANSQDFHLILTANGNNQAANFFREIASKHPNVTVVENAQNQGFWKPNNHAFTLCQTTYFVMLNDDAVPPPGWLDKLVSPLESDDKGALCSPDDGCYTLHDDFHGYRGAVREYCEGSCLMVKSEVAWKHGLFEPLPAPAYAEDSTLSLRYRELGYNLHWVHLRVPHARAQTSRRIPMVRQWQALNHAWARQRFAHYLASRKMTQAAAVIIRRSNAIGDVLLVTPVIRALKEEKPERKIYIETMHPDLFQNNPDVAQAARRIGLRDGLRVNLDNSYEAQPDKHFVHTYAERCGVTVKTTKTFLYPSKGDFEWGERTFHGEWVAIHPGPSTWKDKDWGRPKFKEVVGKMKELGYKVVLVGSAEKINLGEDLDYRGRTNIQQLGALLSRMKLFIGLDSFPMHAAQAMGIPTIGLFGVTRARYIATDGSPFLAVESPDSHPGSGLRHLQKNRTSVQSKENPMDAISVDMVMEAVNKMLPKKEAVCG